VTSGEAAGVSTLKGAEMRAAPIARSGAGSLENNSETTIRRMVLARRMSVTPSWDHEG